MDACSLADRIALLIADLDGAHRPTVAFDGPDAAGKTWLADEVARRADIPVCRASVDGFHAPPDVRRRRGAFSPEGYYRDSFTYESLIRELLVPFRSGADVVRTAVFDFRADTEEHTVTHVGRRAALLFDGVFLLRPELRDQWTLRIYLRVSEDVTLARALRRDHALFGSEEAVIERYRLRYLPGQALYRREARPQNQAHIVIDNDDPARPKILKWVPPLPNP